MDKLEQFIINHKNDFDLYTPSPEVWEKIGKKQQKKTTLRTIKWKSVAWKAAAAVIIFMSAFFLQEYLHSTNKQSAENKEEKTEIRIPQLEEAEAYYTMEVNSKLREMEKHLADNPELKNDIHRDLSELDSIYVELKNDLKDGIASEEIIDAMIQNYRLRVEILENLLKELHKINADSTRTKNNRNGKKKYKL